MGRLTQQPPQHGGQIKQAAEQFGIPTSDWLDLSTGLSPFPWPVPDIPQEVWQRLPEASPGLLHAAEQYYQQPVLPVPGSQWAIQQLPGLFPTSRVWLPELGYQEYPYWWQQQGHQPVYYKTLPQTDQLAKGDVVVVINPGNPRAQYLGAQQLITLAEALLKHQGTLIVDEAFMDLTPETSLLNHPLITSLNEHIVVLRSVGKFYGLAGLRLGFVYSGQAIINRLQKIQGPWAISHPAQFIGELALRDRAWQQQARIRIQQQSRHLSDTLQESGIARQIYSCGLFASAIVAPGLVSNLYHHCAHRGVLIRGFPQWNLVRFGLCDASQHHRLAQCLGQFKADSPA